MLHEVLHSVSVGLTPQTYTAFTGWEEGTVEWLQRHYRQQVLQQLAIDIPESSFVEVERDWKYEASITALKQLAAELASVSEQTFFETLLRTPLADRIAFVQSWGARETGDSAGFRRVFATSLAALRR